MATTSNVEIVIAPTSATNTAISNTSTAAILAGNGYFTFAAIGVDVYIRFGDSAISAATTSNGFAIPAGSVVSLYAPAYATYFRAICASGTGTLSWYQSGPA